MTNQVQVTTGHAGISSTVQSIKKKLKKRLDKLVKSVIVCKGSFSCIPLEEVLAPGLELIFYKTWLICTRLYSDSQLVFSLRMMTM